MKKSNNRAIILTIVIVLAIVIGIFLLCFSLLGKYTLKGIKYLNSKMDRTDDYFNETNIGDYEDIYFQLSHINVLSVKSDATTLVATYTADEYAKQIDKIGEEIAFLETEEEGVYGDFEIGEWNFEVCQFEKSQYPKNFALIGFHEEASQIAYLEFYDADMDLIYGESENDQSMKDFVAQYFNYSFE